MDSEHFVLPGLSRPVRIEPAAPRRGSRRWAPGSPAADLERAGRPRVVGPDDSEWEAGLEAREMQVTRTPV